MKKIPLVLNVAHDASSATAVISGKTAPGCIVRLDIKADGSIEQSMKVKPRGRFQFTFPVGPGETPTQVVAKSGRRSSTKLITVPALVNLPQNSNMSSPKLDLVPVSKTTPKFNPAVSPRLAVAEGMPHVWLIVTHADGSRSRHPMASYDYVNKVFPGMPVATVARADLESISGGDWVYNLPGYPRYDEATHPVLWAAEGVPHVWLVRSGPDGLTRHPMASYDYVNDAFPGVQVQTVPRAQLEEIPGGDWVYNLPGYPLYINGRVIQVRPDAQLAANPQGPDSQIDPSAVSSNGRWAVTVYMQPPDLNDTTMYAFVVDRVTGNEYAASLSTDPAPTAPRVAVDDLGNIAVAYLHKNPGNVQDILTTLVRFQPTKGFYDNSRIFRPTVVASNHQYHAITNVAFNGSGGYTIDYVEGPPIDPGFSLSRYSQKVDPNGTLSLLTELDS